MPWSVSSPMSRRLEFVEDARRALYSMTELCARYEISRRVGYKWLARFEAEGVWSVYFGPVLVGALRRARPAHPRRAQPEQVGPEVTTAVTYAPGPNCYPCCRSVPRCYLTSRCS